MAERDDPMSLMVILPRWMLDELRETAESRDVEVVEYVRRCVALERTLASSTDGVYVLPDGRRVRVLDPDD